MIEILKNEFLYAFIASSLFIIVMVLSQIIKLKLKDFPEFSRKFAHICGGIITLFFPYFFCSWLYPLILCISFFFILIISKRFSLLSSVHGVDRESVGQYLFPIAIFLVYILSSEKSFFVISILVLTFSDSLSALIGKKYGSIVIQVRGATKSLEGSISFIIVTFLVVLIPLLLMTDISKVNTLLIALVVAIVVCGAELISFYGEDNLIIPLSSLFIINKMASNTEFANLLLISYLFISVLMVLSIYIPVRKFKEASLISIMLIYFLMLTVCDIKWTVVYSIFNILIVILLVIYQKFFSIDYKDHNIIKVLLINVPVTVLIFLNIIFKETDVLFVTFVSYLNAALIITAFYFLSEMYNEVRKVYNDLVIVLIISLFSISLITVIPLCLFIGIFIEMMISCSATLIAALVTIIVAKKQKNDIIYSKSKKRWSILGLTFMIVLLINSFGYWIFGV